MWKDSGDDTFVPMAAGHLIPHRQFPFHGDVNLDHLDHPRGQIVTFFIPVDLILKGHPTQFALIAIAFENIVHLFGNFRIFQDDRFKLRQRNLFQCFGSNRCILCDQHLLAFFYRRLALFAHKKFGCLLPCQVLTDIQFVVPILFQLRNFAVFDLTHAIVFFDASS